MQEPFQQTLQDDEATLVVNGEEATLVSPRFDDEETLVARPVVPLEAGAQASMHDDRPAAQPAPYRLQTYAPRRSRMLALVLASVFVGGVLGGAGLYLYQRQTHDPATSSSAATQPETSANADAAPAVPASEIHDVATPTQPPVQQPEAPATDASKSEAQAEPVRVEEAPPAAPAREPESIPDAGRRDEPREGGNAVAPKRGKKGERDEEIERRAVSRPDGNVARADDGGTHEARRVDSIFYRPRRAARRERARRDDDPDRLRRIFEGTP